jgi:hypothetical protein
MNQLTGFVAYQSRPPQVGNTVRAALETLRADKTAPQLASWEESDVAGRFLVEPILTNIANSDLLVADITRLNFNVVFEIGYAIGSQKRLYLIRNSALVASDELIREVGLFDTLGYQHYTHSTELASFLRRVDSKPIPLDAGKINLGAPIYVVLPRAKTDAEIRLISRIKKARQQFRTFDPEEHGRLAAIEAIENVAQSHGVVIPLLSKERGEADVHNLRAAFVAGLAMALDRAVLILQDGEEPVPLD